MNNNERVMSNNIYKGLRVFFPCYTVTCRYMCKQYKMVIVKGEE